MNVHEFEEKLGKKLSEITLNDLNKMTTDDRMMACLSDSETALPLIEEVLTNNFNDDVRLEFTPLKYHHLLYGSQKTLSQLFAKHEAETDKTALVEDIKKFIKGTTPLGKLSAYLLCLTSIDGLDLKEYEKDIKDAVTYTTEVLEVLDIDRGFLIICDLIDLVYGVQQEYFKKYEVDVVDGNLDKLKSVVERVNEFTKPILDNLNEELLKNIPDDSKPEDLGLLDVTKFKNETEKND